MILPPPSLLEKSHYDLAFTGLSIRDMADYSPPVFERRAGAPSEFEILVRLAAIGAGLGAGADPGRARERDAARPRSSGPWPTPRRGSTAGTRARSRRRSVERPPEERLLDLMLRTGHRGDGFGIDSDGLSLDELERHPHGLDFGPLRPRLPDALATESGRVELAPPQLVDDLGRLERALDADGRRWHGPRRAAASCARRTRGRRTCLCSCAARRAASRRCTPTTRRGSGSRTAPTATVRSSAGSIEVPVEITDVVMPGVVCIPYGWGHGLPGTRQEVAADHAGVNVNVLTDASAIDPVSGNAVLNGIPVTIAPA